ncbi:MAG: hypothetical protein FWG37_03930, partial [Clostridia bacterium]|nr:hypothetical protein [Clostridia bacterium]
ESGLSPLPLSGTEALDQVSLGYLRGATFYAFDNAARTWQQPELRTRLEAPLDEGRLSLLTVDVLGRRMVHVLEDADGKQI